VTMMMTRMKKMRARARATRKCFFSFSFVFFCVSPSPPLSSPFLLLLFQFSEKGGLQRAVSKFAVISKKGRNK